MVESFLNGSAEPMTDLIEQEPDPVDELRYKLQDALSIGLSQRYISRESGVPRSTLQDFLSGRVHMPRPDTLVKLESFTEGL